MLRQQLYDNENAAKNVRYAVNTEPVHCGKIPEVRYFIFSVKIKALQLKRCHVFTLCSLKKETPSLNHLILIDFVLDLLQDVL